MIFAAIDLVSCHLVFSFSDRVNSLCPQDALLASRILVSLLRQEDIPYTLIPIGGYSELEARKNQIFGIDPDADEDDQVVSRDCEVRHSGTDQARCQANIDSGRSGTYTDLIVTGIVAADSELLSTRIRLPHPPNRFTSALQLGQLVWRQCE